MYVDVGSMHCTDQSSAKSGADAAEWSGVLACPAISLVNVAALHGVSDVHQSMHFWRSSYSWRHPRPVPQGDAVLMYMDERFSKASVPCVGAKKRPVALAGQGLHPFLFAVVPCLLSVSCVCFARVLVGSIAAEPRLRHTGHLLQRQ